MRVSLNTIKQYINFDLPAVDELVAKINAQLGGVEKVEDLASKYKDAVIVKVVSAEQHPSADRLRVCKVDDGGVTSDVPRDESGFVQVVCGAPNAREGILAVWLPPKSVVPSSYGTSELFVLDARELRGVLSQGMLAAGDELAINNDHDGIIEIDASEWKPTDEEVKPGANFAKVYGLDDTLIDIENKMFTHRPDLFGQIGIAREIAGIFGHKFESPSWYLDAPKFETAGELKLDVFNDAGENVPRFMAVTMSNIEVKPSPIWLQIELMRLGSKSINNIVDATNYVMLLTAQPTHAYDYDKIRGARLGARMAKDGEEVLLLNGKTYHLTKDDIVIADGEGPVGLGGIMGGGNSEVGADTKNIVLEVATFNMYTIRKSSMRHGVFTDALTRFNKGQSPLQNDHILGLLMMSVKDLTSAKQASEVFDKKNGDLAAQKSIAVSDDFINERLGLKLASDDIKQLLENVEMKVENGFNISSPFWRTDLELPEDIVEEVGRLYGFDKLPRELPQRSIKPAAVNERNTRKQAVRDKLARVGANEVLTYSFVHEDTLRKVGQDPQHAFQLGNALSPDLQFYRLSLTPSLLDKVHMNFRAGHDQFGIFEIGKTHFKGEMDANEPNIPNEDTHIAFVLTYGKDSPAGAMYYSVRRYLGQVLDLDDVTLHPLNSFDLSRDEWGAQLVAPYEPNRSAVIVRDKQIWGVVGEFKQSIKKAMKLPEHTAGFEIHFDLLNDEFTNYVALSRFPSITQDISLKVAGKTQYDKLLEVLRSSMTSARPDLSVQLSPVSIYQSKDDQDNKTISFRVVVTSNDRTLQEDEVNKLLDDASQTASTELQAQRA